MRAQVQDAINYRIPQVLNLASTDSRFYSILNQASQRMLWMGKFWGTMARYRVSVTSQIMALPPYIDTVEAIAISRNPVPIHDFLFEFLSDGWGTRDQTQQFGNFSAEALYVGNFPTALDVSPNPTMPTPAQLTVKCDLSSDVGKPVTILGYDANGNWIRTQVASVWQDGEVVPLAQGAGAQTVNTFGQITDIQAPATAGATNLNGQWWLYAGTVSGTLLGNYQYWDIKPSWKRFMIPFLDPVNTFVELAGKKAFIPVAKPTDYLVVGNVPATKLACIAVRAEEEGQLGIAQFLWNGGVDPKTKMQILGVKDVLNAELNHQQGDGREITIDVKPMPGFEAVEVLV